MNSNLTIAFSGRVVRLQRNNGKWLAYDPGNEGKKRVAKDIMIPGNMSAEEVIPYLEDLFHEYFRNMEDKITILSRD